MPKLMLHDEYTRRARIAPALVTGIPIGATAMALGAEVGLVWSAAGAIVGTAGGTALLAQLGRDLGKQREASLFKKWGGRPTELLLSHRGRGSKSLRETRHQKLRKLTAGSTQIPTPEEEAVDPVSAMTAYEESTSFLRGLTRNREKYPLVFEENCNYGFRRNLWGLKPIGTSITLIGLALTLRQLYQAISSNGTYQPVTMASIAVLALFSVFWLAWCRPSWVRTTAEAYADRLMEALDGMDS